MTARALLKTTLPDGDSRGKANEADKGLVGLKGT